jgi:creatinine amidohydrolase
MADHPNIVVKFHNWWNAPKTYAKVQAIDTVASHASWMENFPWTRLAGVSVPDQQKPMVDLALLNILDPRGLRSYLEDGNFGGRYQHSDEDMLAMWEIAVNETRELLAQGWGVA